jgi:4-amino-4-deoxy-L-arabinose transferase-like glycosyltransferase
MKAYRFTLALVAVGVTAIAGAVATGRTLANVDALIGLLAALALIGLVAMEYRANPKRLTVR